MHRSPLNIHAEESGTMEVLSYSLCYCKRDTPSSHCDGILIVPINKISPLPISSLVFNFSRPLHISPAGDVWDVTMKAASQTVLDFLVFYKPKTPSKIQYHLVQITKKPQSLHSAESMRREQQTGAVAGAAQWCRALGGDECLI